jgi:hypothetical protein
VWILGGKLRGVVESTLSVLFQNQTRINYNANIGIINENTKYIRVYFKKRFYSILYRKIFIATCIDFTDGS